MAKRRKKSKKRKALEKKPTDNAQLQAKPSDPSEKGTRSKSKGSSGGRSKAKLSDRIVGLDGIRALATLSVLFYHYIRRYDQVYGHDAEMLEIPRLYIVSTFFILSGLLTTMMIDKSKSMRTWVVSRVARLFPIFWVGVALTFCVVTFYGLPGRVVEVTDALMNLTIVHRFFGFPHVDGVYWTLQIIFLFYVIVGIVSVLGFKKHLLAVFIGLTILHIVGITYAFLDFVPREPLTHFMRAFILKYACFFMIGMLIQRMRTKIRLWHLLPIALFIFDVYTTRSWNRAPMPFLLPLIVFVVCKVKMPWLDNRLFKYVAAVSYALYLVHQNIGYTIIHYGYSLGINGYLNILIAIIVSFGLATLLTYYVEKPIAAFVKRKLTRPSPKRT